MAIRQNSTPLAKYRLGRAALDLRSFTVADLRSLTDVPDNTIYSFLRALGSEQVSSEQIPSASKRGRPRKRYSLTPAGVEALIEQNVEAARMLRTEASVDVRREREKASEAAAPAEEVLAGRLPVAAAPAEPFTAPAAPRPVSAGTEAVFGDAAGNAPMARLQGVTMTYNTSAGPKHALDGLELAVPKGGFVSIVGPSGSGKSTLMSILGLLERPSSGEYWLGGEPVAHLQDPQRMELRSRRFGFVLQNLNLVGDRNVYENVEMSLVNSSLVGTERRRRVEEALEWAGMAHSGSAYPRQLTAGQQQRVAIARAIVGQPEFLLADEPTAQLSQEESQDILEMLRTIHGKGITVCLATQDQKEAQLAPLRYQLEAGRARLVEDRTTGPRPTRSRRHPVVLG